MSARITIDLSDLVLLKAEARGFSLLPRQPVNSLLSGRHASRLRGRGLAFRELRSYHEGDDIRTIDWKATARLRSPQVRVYDEERERPVLFIVDQRESMFFGSRRAMKSVAAAEVAALGIWRAFDVGDRVGAIVFNNLEQVQQRPRRSSNHVHRLLADVARFNQALRTSIGDELAGRRELSDAAAPKTAREEGFISNRLNQALQAADRCAAHDHLVVLISDLDGADDETERLATRLARHNDVIVVAVYDPLGASLVGDSQMLASDGDGVVAVPEGDRFAARFQEEFRVRVEQWRSTFRALKVPVVPIATDVAPAEQLRAFFGHQRVVG